MLKKQKVFGISILHINEYQKITDLPQQILRKSGWETLRLFIYLA